MQLTRAPQRSTRGFAVLDALIAIVILAVGVLAFASVQASVMVSQRMTKMRQYALVAVEDLLERLRANRAWLASYRYLGVPPADPGCGGDASDLCAPAAMADRDMAAWARSLESLGFDMVATQVTTDTTVNPPEVTVEIVWSSPDAGSSHVSLTVVVP